MIVDTTFVIDIMRNKREAVEKLSSLLDAGEPLLLSSLTVFELFSGLARSRKQAEEKEKITKAIEGQLVVGFDQACAEKAGMIDGELISEGKIIQAVDSMIAGTAIVRKEKILTRNVKDFSKVKGLNIESY